MRRTLSGAICENEAIGSGIVGGIIGVILGAVVGSISEVLDPDNGAVGRAAGRRSGRTTFVWKWESTVALDENASMIIAIITANKQLVAVLRTKFIQLTQ